MEPAVNRLPVSVIVLCLAIILVEIILLIGEEQLFVGPGALAWRIEVLERFAFFDRLWGFMAMTGEWDAREVARLITYPFVHQGVLHGLFACVFVLALGKFVGEALGDAAVLAVFLGASAFGALAYAWVWDTGVPLFGAYPGAYGLIGAFTAVLFGKLGEMGENQFRAFSLIGVLMAIQLVFALLFGGAPDWVADLAGALTGFAIALVFQPGAARRILERLRQRS